MSIRAIETAYKGYRFRSRLEARWAVFFDALGIEWQYEPEGFELPGGVRYLPDFFLPKFNGGIWVEVKPKGDRAEKARAFVDASHRSLLVLDGPPDLRSYTLLTWWWEEADEKTGHSEIECAFYDRYLLGGKNAREHRLYLWAEPNLPLHGGVVEAAVYAARGARFEHGEHGALAR